MTQSVLGEAWLPQLASARGWVENGTADGIPPERTGAGVRGGTHESGKFFCKAQKTRQTCVIEKEWQAVRKIESVLRVPGGE